MRFHYQTHLITRYIYLSRNYDVASPVCLNCVYHVPLSLVVLSSDEVKAST